MFVIYKYEKINIQQTLLQAQQEKKETTSSVAHCNYSFWILARYILFKLWFLFLFITLA
jgi:hypothetical protein